ncbi:MAG TPA: 3-hexulose-6-phosphate synthase, partial [Thermoplasmatales archaeon]|nr:3-hexulose-6-phosphate synthase [Thermoplasmatales archaeon]
MKVVLQVALDLMNLHRALQIAKEAVDGGADWIEVGTPLIKSEGMEAVRALKQRFPDKTIVADMKTMDTGALETEMAAKAGADVVCILGASDDETIKDALRAGRKYGAKIMVDFIGVKDKLSRAKEIEKFGVNYLCLHVGIDEQMKGKQPLNILKLIVREVNIPVAVAGGLNSETVSDVVKAGANIVIVGGAITKAKNVTEATKVIKKAIEEKRTIKTKFYKKYSEDELK